MSLLSVRDLSRHFAGLVALGGVSFDVAAGSITALIGPNGAGKTTCFNLIAGALPPTAGRIEFDGRNIAGAAPEALCRLGIARTFQIVRPLAGLSVLENVMIGALARTARVAEARSAALVVLERLGLEGKAASPASGLSLPERKLLETAKALATRPRLLLLDEVMAGLRPVEVDRVAEVIRDLRRDGVTVLLIEHVMRAVMALADRVVVLHHGEKIAEGTPAEVVRDPVVISSYLGRRQAAA